MSKSYIIIADSCMDLSAEQRKEFDVEFPIEGTIIYPDGHGEKADVDWERQSFDDYFNKLNNKKLVFKTALPNQFEIESRLKTYLEKGLDILAITLSGGMSGTYNCFMAAKESLEKQFPDRHMLVVDSRRYSAGISLLCVYASINRDKGMNLQENFQWLEEHKLCGHQIGILDNLFFLHRSGRISYMKAFMGTMVGVKPMGDFSNETGMPAVLGNARGYKNGYHILKEFTKNIIGESKDKIILVTHSIRQQQADEVTRILREELPLAKVIPCRVGQSSGTNVGPGLIAAFFLADKPVSPNCEEEKRLVASLLNKKA